MSSSSTPAGFDKPIGWRDFFTLCKPKVVLVIVFTAMVGMLMSVSGAVPWQPFFVGTLGITLAAASSAAFNHIADRRIDAMMYRTRNRPLPMQRLSVRACLAFAIIVGALSMLSLSLWVNQLTAWLTFCSLIGYAFVYTRYLKWATPQNIVIGGLAGAMPPVLGWAAMTDSISAEPLLLALIIFTWTPPHFWALAIHRKADYMRSEVPMLPVTHGDSFTRLHMLLYTILLLLCSLLPYLIGMTGLIYLVGAVALGLWFLWDVICMFDLGRTGQPIKTFVDSIYYLVLLFFCLLIDHYLPIGQLTL